MAGPKKGARKSGSSRRRSKTTKDEKVEVRTAGEKQYKLPAASKIEHHLANIEAWEAKLTDLKGHVKKAYETAKAEGVSKQLIQKLMTIKGGDQLAARQFFESLGIGLKVIGSSFQMNIFDMMYESDIEQAKAEARNHVANGKSMECRFVEGSEAHEAYVDEFMFQTAKLTPGMQGKSDEEVRASLAREPHKGPMSAEEAFTSH